MRHPLWSIRVTNAQWCSGRGGCRDLRGGCTAGWSLLGVCRQGVSVQMKGQENRHCLVVAGRKECHIVRRLLRRFEGKVPKSGFQGSMSRKTRILLFLWFFFSSQVFLSLLLPIYFDDVTIPVTDNTSDLTNPKPSYFFFFTVFLSS